MIAQPRCGVALQGVDRPSAFIDRVKEIEALGFDNLWLTDSSLHTRDCYSYLTLAATVSTRGSPPPRWQPSTRCRAAAPFSASAPATDRCERSACAPVQWPPWRRPSAPSAGSGVAMS